jgi:hypothetical protein
MPALMLGRMKLGIGVVESKAEMLKPAVLYSRYQSTQAGERDQMKGVEESQGPVVAWMAGSGSMSGHVPGG